MSLNSGCKTITFYRTSYASVVLGVVILSFRLSVTCMLCD